MRKKILMITERRSDYSKFKPILKEISKSKKLEYALVVTGSHLLDEYGMTINEIKKDGFKILSKFDMYEKNRIDSGVGMLRSLGNCIIQLSKILEKEKPDIILAGFDIGANLAVAIAGAHMNIVVAHVEGGDVTGTIDEPIRHSITKFSHIHFTSNKEASERIIKMGENPKYIFTVGSPVMDNIITTNYISDEKLSEKFGLDFSKPFFIILQHTVTTEINEIDQYIKNILSVVKEKDIQTVIIHGNADAGSQKISKIIKNSKINQVYSINFEEYINLLKRSAALIGNSSSGIIETPFLRIPTINIGTRQQGRLRAKNIIDVGYDKKDIKKAIEKVQFDKKFLSKVKNCSSLYGNGNSAKKIIKILEDMDLSSVPIQKMIAY
jgi:UDP-N-acetylglucosamine 2-epimerase (non-hydrolysing)/GDP/UDP-N,N'-diacetylbacillosamine 2-epimerase (hydrolysing)|tara:strand:- start:3253 stop:4395 length:1143 start_codon:yes stop_codon:yes gene_type:complete